MLNIDQLRYDYYESLENTFRNIISGSTVYYKSGYYPFSVVNDGIYIFEETGGDKLYISDKKVVQVYYMEHGFSFKQVIEYIPIMMEKYYKMGHLKPI